VQRAVNEEGAGNVYAAWRMALAARAAAAYAGNGKLAALAVAGSIGAGLADRFSDWAPAERRHPLDSPRRLPDVLLRRPADAPRRTGWRALAQSEIVRLGLAAFERHGKQS
jgi:hypothetical protein